MTTDRITNIINLIEREVKKQHAREPDGSYMAVKLSPDTVSRVHKYIKDAGIPNGTAAEKLHSTLMYSRVFLPDMKAKGKLDDPYTGTPKKLEVWDSQDGNRCLVLKIDSADLEERHKELMSRHKNATWDYPDFTPHITLSYDIGDLDISNLPDLSNIGEILYDNEYGEDLDLNWAEKSTSKD